MEQIPEFLLEMSKQLNTQDNRITADPLWMVCYDKEHVTAEGFEDYSQWIDHDNDGHVICRDDDCLEMPTYLMEHYEDWCDQFIVNNDIVDECRADPEYFSDYFDMGVHDDELPEHIEKFHIKTEREVVKACLTEVDAKWFIQRKQHDYKPLYTYVFSMVFCPQMIELRNWIKKLTLQPEF